MRLLFENEYIKIWLNGQYRCIEFYWKCYPPNGQFKSLMEKVYSFVSEYKCTKLLPDLRNMTSLPEEVRLWAESNWFPRLVRKGVKTYAIVKRTYNWTSDSLDNFHCTARSPRNAFGITTAYFDDIQKARSWIASLPEN